MVISYNQPKSLISQLQYKQVTHYVTTSLFVVGSNQCWVILIFLLELVGFSSYLMLCKPDQIIYIFLGLVRMD